MRVVLRLGHLCRAYQALHPIPYTEAFSVRDVLGAMARSASSPSAQLTVADGRFRYRERPRVRELTLGRALDSFRKDMREWRNW